MKFQNQPLQGVKVLDLSTYGAAPAAGCVLVEWGADVLKVESLAGDPSRYVDGNLGWPKGHGTGWNYEQLNGGKKAVSLDYTKPEGMEILQKLIAESDVFLTNYRLKSLKKYGLDYDTLSAKYPRLIWAHVSGYGEEGPLAADPGFDTVCFWSRGGGLIDFAEKDTAPLTTPMGFGDYQIGLGLAGGISAAVVQQMKTGKGEKVTTALLAQAVWDATSMFLGTQVGKEYPVSRKANPLLANTYRCKDGEWINITCFDWARFFKPVCKLLGLDEFINDPRLQTTDGAYKHRLEVLPTFEAAIAKFDSEEILAELKKLDVPSMRLHHIKDILTDEQVLANNFIHKIHNRFPEQGEWYVPANPVQFGGAYPPVHKDAALLGEDNDNELKRLGYSEEQIETLRRDQIIK